MRVKITLACTECKQRNYNTMKNKKNTPDRLEMNKYCRFCKKAYLAQRNEITGGLTMADEKKASAKPEKSSKPAKKSDAKADKSKAKKSQEKSVQIHWFILQKRKIRG